VAIVDPELTVNLPKMITAATGLDAFCQAIESMWAVGSTDESRAYAIEALQLAWSNLRAAALSPTIESRLAMSRAGHLAGKAINIGKTTSSHALSYFVTSQYGIPHGIAVSLTIRQMLDFNSRVKTEDCTDPRGVSFVIDRINEIIRALGCTSVVHACELIKGFLNDLDCPSSYHEAGIRSDREICEIVASANLERMSNNPRSCNASALFELLSV
jgi:alcohol dehydrogenase class IV